MEGTVTPEVVEPIKETPKPPPVSETAHLLGDIQKLKRERAELEDKLKKIETDDLAKRQEWKTLAELREQELKETKQKLEDNARVLVEDKKFSAIKESALKLGIRKEALADLELVDLDGVTVETTSTGKVNIVGAEDAVGRLKTLRPHWFGGTAPNMNLNQPDVVVGGKLTTEDLAKLEKQAKQTGDYGPYQAAVLQFKKQG